MILVCRFDGEPCDEADFQWSYDFYYGNCFRFNADRASFKYSTMSGSNYGLELYLFLGAEFDTSREIISEFRPNGAQIKINENSMLPNSYEGIYIAAGTETMIQLNKEVLYFNARVSRFCDFLKTILCFTLGHSKTAQTI
jgi:hypothetical protein